MRYIIIHKKPLGILEDCGGETIKLYIRRNTSQRKQSKIILETLKKYLEDLGYYLKQEAKVSEVHSLRNTQYKKRQNETNRKNVIRERAELSPYGVKPQRAIKNNQKEATE